jgi:hypothetical protein
MKTTNSLSKMFARKTRPENLGRRTLALEVMENRMVLTAAMPADAPDCESEQIDVSSFEFDAPPEAPGGVGEQDDLAANLIVGFDDGAGDFVLSLDDGPVNVPAIVAPQDVIDDPELLDLVGLELGEQAVKLLLPAVQQVREAAATDDGRDALFGDLGNDWLVGGTGRDNTYGGWGNDLLNADDLLDNNFGQNNIILAGDDAAPQQVQRTVQIRNDETGIDINPPSQPITFTGLE